MQKPDIKTDFIPSPGSLPAFEADLTASHADTVRTISGMAIEPSLDTLELPSEPWPGSHRQGSVLRRIGGERAEEALRSFCGVSLPRAHDSGRTHNSENRILFEDTDLSRLRLVEANVWWLKIPDSERFWPEERGKVIPAYAIGERMHSPRKDNADAKVDLLLASAYGYSTTFYTATVSSVTKDRIDDLSQQELIVPPSSQEVIGRYSPQQKTVFPEGSIYYERPVDANVYSLGLNRLRTISDPVLRGIKLQRVPGDEKKRAEFYEDLDAALQQKGLRADKLRRLDVRTHSESISLDIESLIEPYDIYQHTFRLAAMFENQVEHTNAFRSIERHAGYVARTAAGHQS
ncbi:MAG: hypothetical protein WBP26_05570 [Candidatus Saccharimonadales bacterium]